MVIEELKAKGIKLTDLIHTVYLNQSKPTEVLVNDISDRESLDNVTSAYVRYAVSYIKSLFIYGRLCGNTYVSVYNRMVVRARHVTSYLKALNVLYKDTATIRESVKSYRLTHLKDYNV